MPEEDEWPPFLPFPEDDMKKAQAQIDCEAEQALPHKERGNQAYQAKRFEEALMHYTKALHFFSIAEVASDKMKEGILLGTIADGCGADSPVKILGNVAFQLEKCIASYLYPRRYFPHRLPAIISGNISIVLRALKRPGAYEAAYRALSFDRTYFKALSLMEKAMSSPTSPVPKWNQAVYVTSLKAKQSFVKRIESELNLPAHIVILSAGMVFDPHNFIAMEQAWTYRELEAIMSSDAYLNYQFEPSPKNVALGICLVPHRAEGKTEGQWLVINFEFLDTSHQLQDYDIGIPRAVVMDFRQFHFCRADPENGRDAQAPPNGKASPRAIAFVLQRVPQVAKVLKERFGLTVKQIRTGQALMDLTGPNGPDECFGSWITTTGRVYKPPSVASRANAAQKFREIDLGEDSERLWGIWDDFARDVNVLPVFTKPYE